MVRMKLLIFCIAACCLVTADTAMAYTASGKVYDNTTTTLVPVSNPTGTISEGVAINPIAGQANGSYSGGWSSAEPEAGQVFQSNAQVLKWVRGIQFTIDYTRLRWHKFSIDYLGTTNHELQIRKINQNYSRFLVIFCRRTSLLG